MKLKAVVAGLILFLFAASALAQTPPRPPSPDVPFMKGFHPPAALMSDWWNDPEIANELHLTEAQKKKLEQVSTDLKLTMIDAGATGLKSYVRLQSLLDADQFDHATYNQELDAASGAAAKLVKDLGQMALNVRTILTAEQWHKLDSLRAAGRMRTHMHHESHEMRDRQHREPPSSLRTAPPQ